MTAIGTIMRLAARPEGVSAIEAADEIGSTAKRVGVHLSNLVRQRRLHCGGAHMRKRYFVNANDAIDYAGLAVDSQGLNIRRPKEEPAMSQQFSRCGFVFWLAGRTD